MNKIVDLILESNDIFDYFSKVYLFGSALDDNRKPNDIDLLLIYEVYSEKVLVEKNAITLFLEKLFTLPIDITVLSEKELEETNFLEKLGIKYKRIK